VSEAVSAPSPPQLRPLGVGEILDVGVKIVWRNAGTLMRAVVFVVFPVELVSYLVQLSAVPSDWTLQGFPPSFQPPADQVFISNSDRLAAAGGQIASALLVLMGTFLASGACYRGITSAYLGHRTTWRESLGFALRRLHSILWVTFLTYLCAGLGLLLCIVPGVYLFGCFAVGIPVLLTENTKGTKALGRSRRLVRGFWWRTIGVVVLGSILVAIVSGVIQGLVLGITSIGSGSSDWVWVIANTIAGTVGSMITTPFTAAFIAVLYFDLRVRKEAFDLQLVANRIGVESPAGELPYVPPPPPPGFPIQPAAPGGPPIWPPPPGWTPSPPPGEPPPPAPQPPHPPMWPPPPAPPGDGST
jgi:hypothetical protein